MIRRVRPLLLATLALAFGVTASAHTQLIQDALVATAGPRGTLQHADVLIVDGRVAAVGPHLSTAPGAERIAADGQYVTPGLFGGITHLGAEEIGEEPSSDDYALQLPAMRPEFDLTLAFNPDSTALGVARVGGVSFAQLAPSQALDSKSPGTIVAGRGGIVHLDGAADPAAHALFVDLGGGAAALSGGSRAAQLMLLEQALEEAGAPRALLPGDPRQLTPAGRRVLADYAAGLAPVVFRVARAADIRAVLAFAHRHGLHAVIQGAAEGWRVATELARAHVPVVLDPLEDLPESFDAIGATLSNAARLHAAGVIIAFSFNDPAPHNIRRLRQGAGIAVAHGLPWDAAIAGLTRAPAAIFGLSPTAGTITAGSPADLVLWDGDPLEVGTLPLRVWIAGREQSMRSRQTELRDRYLEQLRAHPAR